MQPELASGSPEVPNYPGYVFMFLIHPFIRHKIVRAGIVGHMQKPKKRRTKQRKTKNQTKQKLPQLYYIILCCS